MATLYPSVRDRLQLPDEEKFWLGQPPRDYGPLVPEAPMGNILALRWTPAMGGGASLQLLWVHGVGRWLLHHAHDLLACEGIDGPHVILTSATSWIPGSSFYHIPVTADRRARAGRRGPAGAGEVHDGGPADEGRRRRGPDLRFGPSGDGPA